MPFVDQEHRDKPDISIPGDRCYKTYTWMIDCWKKKPSWTCFDSLVKTLWPEWSDQRRADFLALLVFFQIHIMPYEERKRRENGDI